VNLTSEHAQRAATQPAPMVLTNSELLREADDLALRIARSNIVPAFQTPGRHEQLARQAEAADGSWRCPST
jgi:hypothetical protein